jgi:hypothetical protein
MFIEQRTIGTIITTNIVIGTGITIGGTITIEGQIERSAGRGDHS